MEAEALYSSIQSGEPSSGWVKERELEETSSLITRGKAAALQAKGQKQGGGNGQDSIQKTLFRHAYIIA